MLIDEMLPGPNSIAWDGRNRSGEPVPFDTYQCQIRVVVGEAHYVSFDVETSFEGMRMYEVAYDHSRTPLPIYWNDTDVQHLAQIMPNGDISPPTSGSYGIYSGSYSDAAVPHGISNSGNARAWGQFSGSSKGNDNYLDSYTWIESTLSGTIELTAIDGMMDSDADNVSDYEEICVGGTDPDNPDSDGDGVNDDIDMCVGDDTYGDNNGDGICDPPTCDDGVMNGDETDIDCGGGLCLANFFPRTFL